MRWGFMIGLGVLLGVGCWWWRPPAHPVVTASLYETDMVAGLVREILTELKPPVPPVCFLAFGEGGTPPSRDFIARFAGSEPAVRSCNSAAMPPTGQFIETSTGRPGLVVHVIRFKQISPETYDVWVAFSNLPAGHDRFRYRISGAGESWTVKSCTGE